jgi:diguanylate cyclase (GGDEF)-like protein
MTCMYRSQQVTRVPGSARARSLRARMPVGLRFDWLLPAGLVAIYVSWQLLHWIPLRRELAGDVLLLAIALCAACAAVGASRRTAGSPRLRRAWRWVALAIFAQAAGSVAQLYYEAARMSPYPSLADPLYLSFYPLLLFGVLSFPAGRRTAREGLELVLDSAIVMLGGGVVFVYFILGPNAIAAQTPLNTITSVAYPIGDVILLVALGGTLLRGTASETRRSLRPMALAIALFAVADLIYGYIVLHGVYHGGNPIDTLYALAFACFTAAALGQRKLDGPDAQPDHRESDAHASWLPYMAIAAGIAVVVAKASHQPFFPDMSIAIIVALTAGLVVVRQMLSQASISRSRDLLAQDIIERKRMEVQLQYQADHDPLTGLYNRRRFAEDLDLILRNASRYKRHGALLMLDLDDFKVFNDTRGHAAGDRALTTLGQAILDRVRAADVVGRLGGDEFAVVLPEADEQQALAVADDIRAGVAARDLDPAIRITVGLVQFDEHWDVAAEDALVAADIALYEAKEKGKDRVQVYHGAASAAFTWVQRIRTALAEERFVLYAQPMFDLHSDEITHSELLIRMISDDGELIAPGAFLPFAERFGLINQIDRWVVREGLVFALAGERVSINLSAHSIGDASILDALRAAISAGVDSRDVIFEITESAALRNMEEARVFTEALVALGCQVALDDFGTGFGSFTYLKHLPARYLKIDMEFVRDMIFNDTDRQVVDSITKIAHSLGMQTIAEGVEDAVTLQALRDYGVDRAQGFFIGRPQRISLPLAGRECVPEHRLAKIGG